MLKPTKRNGKEKKKERRFYKTANEGRERKNGAYIKYNWDQNLFHGKAKEGREREGGREGKGIKTEETKTTKRNRIK